MKTKEEKAKEYAVKFFPPKKNSDPNAALRHALEEVFIAGYDEAMKWKNPKKELPEEDVEVFVKVEERREDRIKTLYTTSKVVDSLFHSKDMNPFQCEKFLGDGSTKIVVTGWKPIE